MEQKRRRRKRNTIRAAALVILTAALCLAGCGAGTQNGAGAQNGAAARTTSDDSRKEEMGRLCYYRHERDENFDADMEIVEGRINALTDGRYLKEETEVEDPEGPLYAVNFYVPTDIYSGRSLGNISRILISRPMNLWLTNDSGYEATNWFGDKTAIPRDAIESVEMLYGCPEFFEPRDFGMKSEEFNYLRIKLTEGFCKVNPQIWEWEQPYILQDIEGFDGYAHIRALPDAENRCLFVVEKDDLKGYCSALCYSYTHEPLSDSFYFSALPVVDWESGEEIKGAGQIENNGFQVPTVVSEYAPKEAYVSDRNWEQTLQAVRERLDASGLPYAIGHRPDSEKTIVIRIEKGLFSDHFLDFVVKKTDVEFDGRGESIKESPDSIKAAVADQSGKKVLALDLSALRKETFNKLSMNCVKAGGGRIVLKVDDATIAYGYCDKVINDGKFVMDRNAITGEEGFTGDMEWMPQFLTALVSGTQIPIINSYSAAVTLVEVDQVFLTEDEKFFNPYVPRIPRETLYAEIREKLGDMDYAVLGVLTDETPCLQFYLPQEEPGDEQSTPAQGEPGDERSTPAEGKSRNEQIAGTLSRVFKALDDEIFTYWMRFDFIDETGYSVLKIPTHPSYTGNTMKFQYALYDFGAFTEGDKEEIIRLLTEDESLADLADAAQ